MQRWLFLIAINAAVFGVLLVAAEIVLRATEPASGHGGIEFVETSQRLLQPCARLEWTAGRAFIVGAGSEERLAFRHPREKRPGIVRLAVVGESSGATLGYFLGQLLEASPAKERFELLNCAVSGSALEHVERQAQEALAYDPDVLIVVFGHNVDFEYPTDEKQLRLLALRHYSRLLRRIVGAFAGSETVNAKMPLPLRLQRFEDWLRNLVLQSQRQGVGVLLTTLADNLWIIPRTTPEAIISPQFLGAVYEYAIDEERGIDAMSELAVANDEALWEFAAGIWQARAGRWSEARAGLRRALDAEPPAYGFGGVSNGRDRAPLAVNKTIRRVAREQGAWLFDVQKSVAAGAGNGLPGWDVMQDHCHLRPRLFIREARTLFGVAQEAAGIEAAARVSLDAPIDIGHFDGSLRSILNLIATNRRARELNSWQIGLAVEGLVRTFPRDGRAAVDGFMPASADPRQRAEILTGVAYGYWNLGETAAAMEANERARQEPFADPWVQLGLFSLRSGDRQRAEQSFAQAVALEAERADAAFFLERLRSAAGADGLD